MATPFDNIQGGPQQAGMGQPGGDPSMQGAPQAMPSDQPPPPGSPAAPGMQPDPSMGTFGASQQTDPDQSTKNWVDYAFSQTNLAKKLRKKKDKDGTLLLDKMAAEIVQGYNEDEQSRDAWIKQARESMKLAMLTRENKVYPWPKASNIKYPLIATAAMQFSARAYPALVPSTGKLVGTLVIPQDPQDDVWKAARRVSQHMSFQLLHRIPSWEENMDKLLMTMSIVGICYKKTYYDPVGSVMNSCLVYPENLCINYWAKSLEDAYRKTELLYYTNNEIFSKVQNNEEFLDVVDTDETPQSLSTEEEKKKPIVSETNPMAPGKASPHIFLAVHTFWDIDDDGYEEPYIVTIHKNSKKIVRIVPRWKLEGVHRNEKTEIICIDPIEYFTAFPFIPNPDGSIYALGFGVLLGPLNEAVNTLINQLVDSGTLNNMQAGFIGKGLRLKMGQTTIQPGEWKVVNATGEDLQKSVYPIPTKEPSMVLYQLMNMLIQSGNQLASIAEIFVGKMPGQNTPATTTQETIQQGMAVFTAIYKRVYRSLGQEYRKLFWLNKVCPGIVEEESQVCGVPLQASDYDLPDWVIIPGADPSGDSTTVRMSKLQAVQQLMQMGTIDPMVFTQMVLEANEIPNAQQLIKQPQPPAPDPKMQTEQLKQQTMQQKAQLDGQAQQQGIQQQASLAAIKTQSEAQKLQFEQQKQAMELQGQQMETRHSMLMADMDRKHKTMADVHELMMTHAKGQQEMHQQAQKHRQTLTLDAQRARQEQKLAASKPKAKK